MASFVQTLRGFWSAIIRRKQSERAKTPGVILHDPGAQGPHDLDDPFYDPKVQARVADVIAKSAAKKI